MLEGQVTVTIGDRVVQAGVGSFVLVPRGAVHAIANAGSPPGRVLVIFSPAGMEEFFVERQALRAAGVPEYGEAMTALRQRHATEARPRRSAAARVRLRGWPVMRAG